MSCRHGIPSSQPFHSHHKEDATKMVSSYGVSYILAAGQALFKFTKYNLLREEARQVKTAFNNPNTWTPAEASQVAKLTKYFEDPENGKIVMRISIVPSTVLKIIFGTTDVTNFKAAFYNSEDELKAAMTTAVEDYFTKKMKLLINKWWEAAFPPGKDDGAAHKDSEQLLVILYAPEIAKLLRTGSTQQNICNWLKMPWLMPA
eukprot:3094247-Rhodomonas_salina.1